MRMSARGKTGWVRALASWSRSFLEAQALPARWHWARYCRPRRLLPGERHSIPPMAARLGLPAHDQFHNAVATPAWDCDAPEAGLRPRPGQPEDAGRLVLETCGAVQAIEHAAYFGRDRAEVAEDTLAGRDAGALA